MLLALLSLASASAGSFTADEASFLTRWVDCPTTLTADFETLPLATYADTRYEAAGLTLSASAYGALVDDDVANADCRGTRCVRVPVVDGFGAEEQAWMSIATATPMDRLSFWLVDFGNALSNGQATVVASRNDVVVDTLTFVPGGSDLDGGVFVGLELDAPADEVVIRAQEEGDTFGLDDIRVPSSACSDDDGDGQTEVLGDCDDTDASIYGGAPELCDGVDDDCDAIVPVEELDGDVDGWMDCIDRDGDGVGYGDCDPEDPTVYPGAVEACTGVDENCDGVIPAEEGDHDFDGWIDCIDRDGDGVGFGDCGPTDPEVHPGAPEVCDGLDDGCDGVLPVDELDNDFDGWIDCVDRDGDGVGYGDCGPTEASIHPGAPELCNGVDDDCDGTVPTSERDADLDGYRTCEGDCRDDDPAAHPLAVELRNGADDDCDGVPLGGTIGCAHAGARSTHGLLAALALGWALVGRRRRRWLPLLGVAFTTGVALAAFRDDLLVYEAAISDAAYQDEMRATNLGRQVVVQVTPAVFEEVLLDWLNDDPSRARFRQTWGTALPLPWTGTQEFAVDVWVDDLSVGLLDGNRLQLVLGMDGYVDAPGLPGATPERVQGDLIVTLALQIREEGGGPCPTGGHLEATQGTVDTTGLQIPGPTWLQTLASASVAGAVQVAFAAGPIELYDLSVLYGFGTTDLPSGLGVTGSPYDLELCVADARLRTIPSPDNSEVGVVMVGVDVLDLPECYPDLAASGEYRLFTSTNEVFDAVTSSIVPARHEVGLGVSTGMLERLWWNLVWNMPLDVDGNGSSDMILWDYVQDVEHDLSNRWFVNDYHYDRDTNWDGFATPRPVQDPTVAECDGWSYGEQVLELADPARYPFFRTSYGMYLEHGPGCNSTAGFAASMRFDVSNRTYGEPVLAVEVDADSYLNPSGWKQVLDVIDAVGGCGYADPVDDAQKELQNAESQVIAMDMARLFGISDESSDPSYAFPYVEARPALLVFGGRIGTGFTADLASAAGWPSTILWPSPWTPAVGTIAGLNAGMPDPPVLADGQDPSAGTCPLGYERRSYTIADAVLTWCEFSDVAVGAPPATLPTGTWCGLDVHPRHEREICDDLDNDADGQVDEDFLDEDGDGFADCFEDLGGADGDLGNDLFPVQHHSTCGGYEPRTACPPGFTRAVVWIDTGYAACLKDPTICTLAGVDPVTEADLVTCVADGSAYDVADDPLLPEGLVRHGEIVGYTDGSESSTCTGPVANQPTGYDTRYFHPLVGRWVSIGPGAGELRYCPTAGNGGDADADGLVEADEVGLGTDSLARSTDADVFSDGEEILLGTDPTSTDSDGDGLSDLAELVGIGSDPARVDSDSDGLPDGYEIWVTRGDPLSVDTDGNGLSDGDEEALYDLDNAWFTWGEGVDDAPPPVEEGGGLPPDGFGGGG